MGAPRNFFLALGLADLRASDASDLLPHGRSAFSRVVAPAASVAHPIGCMVGAHLVRALHRLHHHHHQPALPPTNPPPLLPSSPSSPPTHPPTTTPHTHTPRTHTHTHNLPTNQPTIPSPSHSIPPHPIPSHPTPSHSTPSHLPTTTSETILAQVVNCPSGVLLEYVCRRFRVHNCPVIVAQVFWSFRCRQRGFSLKRAHNQCSCVYDYVRGCQKKPTFASHKRSETTQLRFFSKVSTRPPFDLLKYRQGTKKFEGYSGANSNSKKKRKELSDNSLSDLLSKFQPVTHYPLLHFLSTHPYLQSHPSMLRERLLCCDNSTRSCSGL